MGRSGSVTALELALRSELGPSCMVHVRDTPSGVVVVLKAARRRLGALSAGPH